MQYIQRLIATKKTRVISSVAVASLILITGASLYLAHASGFFSSVDPENGSLTSNVQIVNDSSASGGKAIQFTAPVTPPPPPPPTSGFPDATTTGYKAAPDYPGHLNSCPTTVQSNTTYNFCDYPGGLFVGSSSSHVSNVTFHGCRFHGVSVNDVLVAVFGDNITFDYSSFEPGVSAPPVPFNQSYQYGIEADGSYNSVVQQLTVTHSNFWGFGNAIDIAGSTQAKPQVFRDNYIHDASADGGGVYHTDGIGTESGSGTGSYVVIDHNTIESLGNTNGIAFQAGHYDHYTITNNLLGGFGYTMALLGSAPYTTFTGNTFSTRLPVDWGPVYPDNFWSTTGSIWKNNKWLVPSGAAWGNATHSGWYWVPNTTANSGSSDTPFVSQTDFQ